MTPEAATAQGLAESAYATYNMGLFFDDKENTRQPKRGGRRRGGGWLCCVSGNPQGTAQRLQAPRNSHVISPSGL